MLLLLTNKNDSHADHFIRLTENRFPILRINTDDFFDEYEFEIYLTETGSTSGFIRDKLGHSHDLGNKTLAWYRKPQFDEMNVGDCGNYRDFIIGETRAFFEILYTLPTIHWINDPLKAHSARSKWQQLILAKTLGFNIPKSLIANNEHAVQEFALKANWPIITKSIYSASIEIEGMAMACSTTEISEATLNDRSSNLKLCPNQFQEKIDKSFELRVTVIGSKVFATKIYSQDSATTKIDWRLDVEACRHEPFDLPSDIEDNCRELVKRQGLEYGAIDLICDKDGQYVFLENNPFGQYLWLELETSQKITNSLIDLFETKLKY